LRVAVVGASTRAILHICDWHSTHAVTYFCVSV
jgi:hypothetical protein